MIYSVIRKEHEALFSISLSNKEYEILQRFVVEYNLRAKSAFILHLLSLGENFVKGDKETIWDIYKNGILLHSFTGAILYAEELKNQPCFHESKKFVSTILPFSLILSYERYAEKYGFQTGGELMEHVVHWLLCVMDAFVQGMKFMDSKTNGEKKFFSDNT